MVAANTILCYSYFIETKHTEENKMFKTKEECQAYIVETHGADYLKFEIVTAQKVGPSVARMLGIEEGWWPSNAY